MYTLLAMPLATFHLTHEVCVVCFCVRRRYNNCNYCHLALFGIKLWQIVVEWQCALCILPASKKIVLLKFAACKAIYVHIRTYIMWLQMCLYSWWRFVGAACCCWEFLFFIKFNFFFFAPATVCNCIHMCVCTNFGGFTCVFLHQAVTAGTLKLSDFIAETCVRSFHV